MIFSPFVVKTLLVKWMRQEHPFPPLPRWESGKGEKSLTKVWTVNVRADKKD